MSNANRARMFTTATVIGLLATTATAENQEQGLLIPNVSANVTLDYVTQYFFRGIEQSNTDTGGSFQPGASFTIGVAENLTATVGTWLAFEADPLSAGPFTPGSGNPSSLYEQDVYAKLDATLGDFAIGLGLTYYNFPSTATNVDITELNLSVRFDDSDLLGDFAFAPYVAVAIELHNTAAPDENAYLELGGAFTLPTEGTAIQAWDWSVPFAVGLSIDNYYTDASGEDEFFGYASVGLVGSIPLSELIGSSEYLGAWDLTVGVTVLFLNSDVALTDNADDASNNLQFVGQVGISRTW